MKKAVVYGGILMLLSNIASAEIVFSENFDDQADYTSDHSRPLNFGKRGEPIPKDWFAVRQSSAWDPANGHPMAHESIEILAENSDKAKGKSGKSLVLYRESLNRGKGKWTSEGLLLKYLEKGHDQLHVSFWINFDPGWTKSPGWTTKMFRVYSWDKNKAPITKYFSKGGSGPIALWDYQVSGSGMRNRWSFRSGPHGANYNMTSQVKRLDGFPSRLRGKGDVSLNFTSDTKHQGENGKTPLIPDRQNGGYIPVNKKHKVGHDQIFGESGSWTKVAFYVQMNSSPGAKDGVLKQWINDELILSNSSIPWTGPKPWPGSGSDEMPKWNVVAFGGNSYFAQYPDGMRHEEWYAIDDIVVSDRIPE